jgi:hypothetical protein
MHEAYDNAMRKWILFLLLPLALGLWNTAGAAESKKTLVVLWRADCPPCMREMRLLPQIARGHPGLPIELISLQDEETSRKHLASAWPGNVHLRFVSHEGEKTLAMYGDTRRILPFSAFLHEDGSICRKHYGILGMQRADHWVKSC